MGNRRGTANIFTSAGRLGIPEAFEKTGREQLRAPGGKSFTISGGRKDRPPSKEHPSIPNL
jgi:hypothetical protein